METSIIASYPSFWPIPRSFNDYYLPLAEESQCDLVAKRAWVLEQDCSHTALSCTAWEGSFASLHLSFLQWKTGIITLLIGLL